MRAHRDFLGSLLGILVFLGGVALLGFTFKIAYDMFTIPQANALNLQTGKPVDLTQAGQSFAGLILKVLLLVVMAITGSLIANRGIKLYSDSRSVLGRAKAETEVET